MRRGLALARDYAKKRRAFGKPLADHPLHRETLASLQVEFEAAFLLTFRLAQLLGKDELGEARPSDQALLRLLTPLVKLYTAKQAIATASETLEAFGGAGYVEDTGLPRLLRDAQVLSIWEGTTNVLSLDVLRALKTDGAFPAFRDETMARLPKIENSGLKPLTRTVQEGLKSISAFFERAISEGGDFFQAAARSFSYSLARTYAACLLLEHAEWLVENQNDNRGIFSAQRWCARNLAPLLIADESHRTRSKALALDEKP
jgi:hypothetical protein